MGKIFGDVKQGKPLTERETLQNKYNAARGNLLLAIAFTLINIVLLFVETFLIMCAYNFIKNKSKTRGGEHR